MVMLLTTTHNAAPELCITETTTGLVLCSDDSIDLKKKKKTRTGTVSGYVSQNVK